MSTPQKMCGYTRQATKAYTQRHAEIAAAFDAAHIKPDSLERSKALAAQRGNYALLERMAGVIKSPIYPQLGQLNDIDTYAADRRKNYGPMNHRTF